MMRSIWKGHIRFSLVTIPVRIYNAIDTAQTIRFNQLHKDCNGAVGYEKKCKKCHESLKNEEILKGYQYEPDQYVVMESEDFEKVRLKSTKVIEIEGFVDASEVHPTLYDAPYFAGPDAAVAAKPYALLCQALLDSGKVGIGKVVLRDREDVVIIAPQDGGLVLYKLRYPEEVRRMQDVPQLDGQLAIDTEQLKLARHLLDTMSTSLDKIALKDSYHEGLMEVIQAKIEGREVVAMEEEDRPVVDIMTALKQSIEQAKSKQQPMVKATGKGKKAEAETEAEAAKPAKTARRKRA